MMNKSILALVMVAAFSSQASAGTFSTSQYTISFDDTFWGIDSGTGSAWNSNKGTLTFSGLGLSSSAKASRFGEDSSAVYWSSGWDEFSSSVLTITAKDGFKIASITTDGRGVLTAVDSGVSGVYANASSYVGGYWDTDQKSPWFQSEAHVDGNSDGQGRYTISSTVSFAGDSAGEPAALTAFSSLSESGSSSAASGAQSASLSHFYADLYANAKGLGSTAKATLNAVSFSVNVVPSVPEPETYAMLLAGLGLMGTIARRRSRKCA